MGMYARLKMGGSPVWIASQTTIPQLATIADAASRNIWVESAAPGIPPTLIGIPVLFHDRSVALGTAGDLVLADLSYYLIKDGSGPFVAASEHVYFTSNKTVVKIFMNVDGKPWLNEPLPLEGSTSNTVSPFIVLA
jgi:HK97 family phage major capsid protein